MNRSRLFLVSASLVLAGAASAQETKPPAPAAAPEPPATVASVVDRQVSSVEKLVVEAAEAMPAEKYGFTPEALKIPGSDYKGVRTFAQEVRHVASLTAENNLRAPEGSKSVRLHRATFGVAHAYDHYGQMVAYLRMNGIVPPASRAN